MDSLDARSKMPSYKAADGWHPALLIVSEVRLFSEGLAEALGRSAVLSAIAHCSDLPEAMARLPTLQPDIILLDASIFDGLTFVRSIHRMAPHVLVVVLALTETPENVIAWAEAGVVGYIPKSASLADVVPTLLGIRQGEQICSPSVAAGLIRRVSEQPVVSSASDHTKPLPPLTAREQQIIDLISAGLSNKEIARRLNIGVATTKSHVHNLLAKLKVQQRSHAAIRVREQATIANIPTQLTPSANSSRPRSERSGSENAL